MIGSFWDFSVKVYARPGVADSLLEMQNVHGADVNLALYCAWHAASGRGALSATRIKALDARLQPWRSGLIQPLRDLRQQIKNDEALHLPHAGEARAKILEAELACEQVAQQLLESLTEIRSNPVSAEDACKAFEDSLRTYCRHLAVAEAACLPVVRTLTAAVGNN